MMRRLLTWLTLAFGLCLLSGLGQDAHAAYTMPANGIDSIPKESLVFVEGLDSTGKAMGVAVGVLVKKGYVALNYHYLVGASSVVVYRPGEAQRYKSDGYLSVEENLDLIVISVPELAGKYCLVSDLEFPKDGASVQLTASADQRRLSFANALVHGKKDIEGLVMSEMIASNIDDCTGGPIFQRGQLVGFTLAGYLDESRYYAYGVPAYHLKRLLTRSFIIKTYTSFKDMKPTPVTAYQGVLMESLEAILWRSMEDAGRLVPNNGKLIFVDITTEWTGWSNLMKKNTYSKKGIIRYLNENFVAVRLDAETDSTIVFNDQAFSRQSGSPYHSLAYSLLEGNMQFPSLVIIAYEGGEFTELLAVPGYMDGKKLEVMLHYFVEKIYRGPDPSFARYEQSYWQRQAELEGK